RRLRRRPRPGAWLGHRCRRLELRRGRLRALPGDRRRRGRLGRGATARGDLPRGRRRGERQDGMKAFVAIVRREVLERRTVLSAAAVAALPPVGLPALRRLSAAAQGWASLLIALVFALGIAASLGAAMIVPRIANRRIAFDLARPVSAAAIWIGSIAAATILALA